MKQIVSLICRCPKRLELGFSSTVLSHILYNVDENWPALRLKSRISFFCLNIVDIGYYIDFRYG